MPHINRIRVNNVKYNVGTQFYDDLCLRFQGKNSLYDLANGGGKSVLMLLLLQNLIPNCTLDDKQPIEKLFRGSTGSGVIHSLIEWELDKVDQEEKGFRFMTTGFCARKKADRIREGEEEISSSAIEYFNYCIFYNEFQDYDIRNLPLVSGNERITFKGLKELLKRLQNESNRRLKVKVFENTKSEYQRFIAGYGLYESQWNMIRGINKTEGHVRAYFENNYRTSRKVVEDLLIEEIIQKAYSLRTGKEKDTEELAQTLLEIRDQMVELSQKKQQIACYDRQIGAISEFIQRFEPLMQIFEQRDINEEKTSVLYHELLKEQERLETLAQELEEKLKLSEEQKKETERQLQTLELQELEYAFDEVHYDREKKEKEAKLLEESQTLLHDAIISKESVNYFLQYKKAQSKEKTIEAEIESLKKGNEELLSAIVQMTAQKKRKDEDGKERLISQKEAAQEQLSEYRREWQTAQAAERKADISLGVLKVQLTENQQELAGIQQEIRECAKEFPVLLREQIAEELEAMQTKAEKLAEAQSRSREEQEQKKEELHNLRLTAKDIEHQFAETESSIRELETMLATFRQKTEEIRQRQEAYQEPEISRLAELLEQKQTTAVIEEHEIRKQLNSQEKYLRQLEEGILFRISEEAEALRNYIYGKYQDGVFGSELLELSGKEEKRELLEKAPYLPYGIVVSGATYEKIRRQPKPEEWQNVSWIIPVFDREFLAHGHGTEQQGVMFAGKDASYFLEQESLEREKEKTKSEIARYGQKLAALLEQKEVYAADRKAVQEYIEDYLSRQPKWEQELQTKQQMRKRLQEEQSAQQEKSRALEVRLEELEKQIPQTERTIAEQNEQIRRLSHLGELFEENDRKEAEQKTFIIEETALLEQQKTFQNRMTEYEEKMTEEEGRLRLAEEQLGALEENWKRYSVYYKEEIVPKPDVSEHLEEELDGAITAFENENKDVREKRETLRVLKEQKESALREVTRRAQERELLETAYEQNHLVETDEKELITLRERLGQETKALEGCKKQLEALKELCTKYQSQAELLEQQIMDKFQVVKRMQVAASEIDEVKEQLQVRKRTYRSEYDRLSREQKENAGKEKEIELLCGRVNLLVEQYGLQKMDVTEMAGFVVVDYRETEQKLSRDWQKLRERRETARTGFRKAQSICEEELVRLGAGSLAAQMKEQIHVPEDSREAEKTVQNLQKACAMIQVGRDQVESGLQEIEKIRNSFEHQCLQRCSNIRMELDKFPKLSSIMIDNQLTQIVKLRIPYVKEEQQQMCIGNYLSQVIENLGRYENEQEKKKYLIQELSMKRLFSAIVTDMNRISLELYKRERVKEQSRHLKYEEAVGSTGQSQGIYIQFLIAVINYIASMNSCHANHESLKKVIFIDNPFGAAKDTYIWEPIFAMLAANRVQLIVPTRGATPAIIGKFDINYLLGQKMVGTKQQTVVVDYRSKIETEDAEYVNMEYEQPSLF